MTEHRTGYIGYVVPTPELLEQAFELAETRNWMVSEVPSLFLYTGLRGLDNGIYGHYSWITRRSLENRVYKLENVNGYIGIFFLDVVYDPRTFKEVPVSKVIE